MKRENLKFIYLEGGKSEYLDMEMSEVGFMRIALNIWKNSFGSILTYFA